MEFAGGRRGHLADAALAAAGLAYSGLLAALSFQYTVEAQVFALVATAACVLASAVYLVTSLRAHAAAPPDRTVTAVERAAIDVTRRRLVAAAALVAGSIPFLYFVGVHAYSFIFALVFLRVFAGHPWRAALAVAAGLTVFNYLLFTVVFDLKFDTVGVLLP